LAILAFLILALQHLAIGYLQRQDRGVDELGVQSKAAIPLLLHPAVWESTRGITIPFGHV